GVALEREAELHDGGEIALVEPDLPVVREPRHLREQGLEEVRAKITPGARDLLVEPASQRREPAEREPARAGLWNPARHVARAVADQRHHSSAHRRQDDLTVAVGVGVSELDAEVELVHVIARALRAFEAE